MVILSSGEIVEEASLFYYEPGTDHDSHSDASYEPAFEPITNPDINQTLVLEVCGNNQFCIFDFQLTGSADFAVASLQTFNDFENGLESTTIGE